MTLRETFAAKHSNVHVNMRWLLGFLTFKEDRILHVHAPGGILACNSSVIVVQGVRAFKPSYHYERLMNEQHNFGIQKI
jgi:hypothetical protein